MPVSPARIPQLNNLTAVEFLPTGHLPISLYQFSEDAQIDGRRIQLMVCGLVTGF
ncbi:hypothetical protein K440DRAFT_619990 [Wilcoxina mikolae CBS 423.85]|nr:hypothetical protein K440DRAFT_619990 [Wilcoxina mikolae CBS 423.85]